MTSRTFFPAIVVFFLLIGDTAYSQVNQSKPEVKVDTSQVHSISIADLEMIDPENRLIPESKAEATQWSLDGYVESPLSSEKTAPAKSDAKITRQDLRMLESMSSPKKQHAASAPSR